MTPWTLEQYRRSGSRGESGIGRSKDWGRTGYHRREPSEREPDVLALLQR